MRGRGLGHAKAVQRGGVVVQPPTQPFVEILGSVDVGHGDSVSTSSFMSTLPTVGSELVACASVVLMSNLLVALRVSQQECT